MKIFIAVPSMDSVPAIFAQSLSMLQKPEGCECAISFQIGSLIYNSRNALAKKAIELDADYIFWLDSDMLFEPDTLIRLFNEMQEKDLNILSGVYFRRVEPYTPVLFKKLRIDEKNRCEHEAFNDYPKDELFEAEGIGFGCVLMKTQVLFDVLAKYQDFFSPINLVGEDLSFCYRARECGYKIHVDPNIPLGHCGHTIITKAFYEAFNKQKGD